MVEYHDWEGKRLCWKLYLECWDFCVHLHVLSLKNCQIFILTPFLNNLVIFTGTMLVLVFKYSFAACTLLSNSTCVSFCLSTREGCDARFFLLLVRNQKLLHYGCGQKLPNFISFAAGVQICLFPSSKWLQKCCLRGRYTGTRSILINKGLRLLTVSVFGVNGERSVRVLS